MPALVRDQELELVIDSLAYGGRGVARHGELVVFVARALPGDRVRARVTKFKRRYAEARAIELLEAGPGRVTPRCEHFGVCGGCALQHLSSAAQLAAKETELRDALTRLARATPAAWLAPLAGPVWGYRRRARLGAKYVRKKGTVVVGFRERAAPYVAQLRHCQVLAPPAGALIAPLAELINALSIRERLPQIEVAVADNATALVLRVLDAPTAADQERLAAFGAAHGVRLYLQSGGLDSVRELGAAGEPLRYALPGAGVELEFAPTDFIQVNGALNAALVQRALELLEPTASSTVLDLFCGLGNFTLALARVAGSVVGIEGDATLVERARHNALRNGIENAAFHAADLFKEVTPGTAWAARNYTHVLLDPPRAGAREILPLVAKLAPRNLVYISCHPGSLARDVGILAHEHGFHVAAAGMLDMFPHTGHVESIAVLRPS